MTDEEYKQWWPLHLRAVQGETLSDEERRKYDAGIRHLDEEEARELAPNREQFSRFSEAITALRRKEQALREEQRLLDSEIAELEAKYHALAGTPLSSAA